MNRSINLILGVHNHQPVDNWDPVMEEAYRKCYQPFLDVLEAYPAIGMSLHYTGYLLDWLFERQPNLIAQLQRLIQRGQVEMIGGAYYEPVLAIIPDRDKRGQIDKLSERIEALTGQRPQGLWLAERVWEPHLVQPIAQAGLRYLFLDDSHFTGAGLEPQDLHGRYTSEEQGHTVDIFPVDQTLRYQIPYASPQATLDYLDQLASADGQKAAIYFDDGEKFGVWPGSYGLVFREKWLERFFQALTENRHWINTLTPSQYIDQARPLGRVYLPTASYSEMMEWALPARQWGAYQEALKAVSPSQKRFVQGGFWRNFLVKYPEANNIHKKMLYVSEKIHRLQTEQDIASPEALQELWKGQSNDIFWHGVFGGLYLTNLRTANYQHLIQAEKLVDDLRYGPEFLRMEERDFDCDGQTEILIESNTQNLYLHPHEGGSLFELDYRLKNFNLLDTLARRYEPYHDHLQAKPGEGENTPTIGLAYDWHRRVSLLDHFWGPETTLTTLAQAQNPELGDFINQHYEYHLEENEITLWRTGSVQTQGQTVPIRVEKTLIFPDLNQACTVIRYTLSNLSATPAPLWFAVEFNVNLLAGNAPDRYYYLPTSAPQPMPHPSDSRAVAVLEGALPQPKLRSKKLTAKEALKEVFGMGLRDEWLDIDYHLIWNRLGNVWRFPIETVSKSERGFDKVYQSSAVFPNWKVTLEPYESWQVEITQRISSHR